MEILKPNDILIATLNKPEATPYDLLSSNINGSNTSLFSKDEYKQSEYIKNTFTGSDGKFDDLAFDKAYKLAQNNYYQLTNNEYLKELDQIEYSPFDITRPKFAKTINVSATLEKEYNPFEEKKGWTGINSTDASNLSLRELAQQGKIFDPINKTWSEKSLNDLSLLDKVFGDTLVYAQFDEDGQHVDSNGFFVDHKKGDWKVNEDGNLFIEKLGNREIYGKQIVNSMDTLTTDGSLINKFDFLDSDGREKSITGTVFKLAANIAPFIIPEFGIFKGMTSIPSLYGGLKATIGLASSLPTFYKALEGLLLGDTNTSLTKGATQLESYFAKMTQSSVSDAGGQSLFGVEQMSEMVGSIFSQIYEQRAAASLSKLINRGDSLMTAETKKMADNINQKILSEVLEGKIDYNDMGALSKAAMEKIPSLKSVIDRQSKMSKAFSLGYMALTSTADIYGQALQGGYDRRTAGFAALLAASGQYGIMMNNRMGDWFLDKTTGYSLESNKALMRKTLTPWFDEIADGFKTAGKDLGKGKQMLGGTFSKFKNSLTEIFTTPSTIAEAMWKNSLVEGIEEVTEQMVLDASKGVVDTMSYLGLTKKQGSLGGWNTAFSKEGFETYLANFVGGIIGGGMFEFHRSRIAPWLDPSMVSPDVQKSMYELVAGGHKDELINMINAKRSMLGNKYITVMDQDGHFQEASETNKSQADLIADKAIDMVNVIDGILNSNNLIHSDEEIVSKAIMDHIIINDMKKTIQEGSSIGIEGLVLEDYKRKMLKIGELEATLKNLAETDENKDGIKRYKEELKLYVNDINDIMEGKKGHEYFGEASFYLNKKINSAFLKISKFDFTKETYKQNYYDLPETGIGLTRERIDKEWNEFIESKDLRNNLKSAYQVYKNLEQLINKPIEDFTKDGYDQVRKQTFETIIDLKKTIELFNTTVDPKAKEEVLNRFVSLNNALESMGQGIITPWTVLHDDIFDQLDTLGLIKKVEYDLVNKKEVVSNFSQQELNSKKGDITTKDDMKRIVSNFFKSYNFNPMNAEMVISHLNTQILELNKKKFDKIAELQNLPILSDEQTAELQELENSLINFKIDDFSNINSIKVIFDGFEMKINTEFTNSNITRKEYDSFKKIQQNKDFYVRDFNSVLKEFGKDSWKDLDRLELNDFLSKLTELGFLTESLRELNIVSPNSEMAIEKAIVQLQSETLTPEEFIQIQDSLEEFMTFTSNLINKSFNTLNNSDLINLDKKITEIEKERDAEINEKKPDILKIHNYALDLLVKALESGTADKEVFYEAEELVNTEIIKVISKIFPNTKSLSYTSFIQTMEEMVGFSEMINEIIDLELNNGIEDIYLSSDSLEHIITMEEEAYKADAMYKGLFPNQDFLNVIKNNFDLKLNLEQFNGALLDLLNLVKLEKKNIDKINKFFELVKKGLNLKSNSLYDFIRNFELTLDSNPESKINKIFELLKREETNLKASSNVTNFTSDNIREQDLNQAVNHLEMMKAVIYAMSTTTVDFGDPYGYIQSRINYAKKYNQEDDVINLKTITSDVATLMIKDLDLLITKINFLKDLASFNAGKMFNEQEIIRIKVNEILLANWKQWLVKMNPSFLPLDKLNQIINSSNSNEKKILDIETAIFEHNKGKEAEALEEFLKHLTNVNPDNFSQIDKDLKEIKSWELALYAATTLSSKASDFQARNYKSIAGTFAKAPFFTQEFVSRIIKASTANPTLFANIFKTKQNASKFDCSFITILLGGSGTGKTSATLGLALDNFKQTNDISNVWISAPDDTQVNNLEKAIKESTGNEKLALVKGNKFEIFEKLGLTKLISEINKEITAINDNKIEKKYIKLDDGSILLGEQITNKKWLESIPEEILKNLPNLLLIDEVTHFSAFEMYLLNAISEYSYNNDSLNFMKIIGAGDTTQLGYLAKIGDQYVQYNINTYNAIFTPRLWLSVRSSNNQKRLNDDKYKRINREVESIYDKENDNRIPDYDKAKLDALTYLNNTKRENLLAYHQKSNIITGDKIMTSLDKDTVAVIAAKLKEDSTKTLGILTSNGKLPEDWNKLFTETGIITPSDMSKVKFFTPENIQGSEVDYFIFDASLIKPYDKLRDNLKAFYTYISRSKVASIIVDNEELLKKWHIENGPMDAYSVPFEFLTKSVIDTAKKQKIEDIVKLLGENPTPSSDDNFKWKIGITKKEELGEEVVIGGRYVTPDPTYDKGTVYKNSTEENKLENDALKDGFKIMAHSFYNNPGAELSDDKSSLIVNPGDTPFDLNVSKSLAGDEVKEVVNGWGKLKNHLLHKNVEYILPNEFDEFIKYAFPNTSSLENIEVERVITVSTYKETINNTHSKIGFDKTKTLKNGDLFINISAKLTYGNKIHYITLASFATLEEIAKKAKEYNVDIKEVEKRWIELESQLEKSDNNFIELKIEDPNSISFITGTRLEKLPETASPHTLASLKEKFPGLHVSNIKFYPNDYNDFKNLLSKYTFGPERSEETMSRMFYGYTEEDKKGKKTTYSGLKNKPYIIVSFKDDLDGGSENIIHAKLIPITSNKRSITTLTKEVDKILDERANKISVASKEGKKGSQVFDNDLNAKAEILLNRSDILDTLIFWETKDSGEAEGGSLLDLFNKKIEFSLENQVSGNTTSVFEVFSRFKTDKGLDSEFSRVITEVKKSVKNHTKDGKLDFINAKKELLANIKGIKGWHWTFFNLFGYEKIIDEAATNELAQMVAKNLSTDELLEKFNASEGRNEMIRIIEKLLNHIKSKKFYYSIPIKPAAVVGGPVQANSFISGENGWNEDNFGDKFFIGITPESGRLLFDLQEFLKSNIIQLIKNTPGPVVKTTPTEETEETEVEEVIVPEEVVVSTIDEDIPIIDISTEEIINNFMLSNFKNSSDVIKTAITNLLHLKKDLVQDIFADSLILLESESFIKSDEKNKLKAIINSFGFTIENNVITRDNIQQVTGITEAKQLKSIRNDIQELLKKC